VNHRSVCRKNARSNRPKPVVVIRERSDNEIDLGLAARRPVRGADVERPAAPLGEHLDRVIERTSVGGAELESAGELLLEPRGRPVVDVLMELVGDLGENPFMSSSSGAWLSAA
jgi:hypothetical protein